MHMPHLFYLSGESREKVKWRQNDSRISSQISIQSKKKLEKSSEFRSLLLFCFLSTPFFLGFRDPDLSPG